VIAVLPRAHGQSALIMRASTPLFRLTWMLRQFLNFKSATIKVGASRSVAHPQNAFVEFSNAAHSNYFLGYDLSRALNVWADYTDPRHNRTLRSNELGDFQCEIVCETHQGLWHRACSIDKHLVVCFVANRSP
jgi:hypothetical protein